MTTTFVSPRRLITVVVLTSCQWAIPLVRAVDIGPGHLDTLVITDNQDYRVLLGTEIVPPTVHNVASGDGDVQGTTAILITGTGTVQFEGGEFTEGKAETNVSVYDPHGGDALQATAGTRIVIHDGVFTGGEGFANRPYGGSSDILGGAWALNLSGSNVTILGGHFIGGIGHALPDRSLQEQSILLNRSFLEVRGGAFDGAIAFGRDSSMTVYGHDFALLNGSAFFRKTLTGMYANGQPFNIELRLELGFVTSVGPDSFTITVLPEPGAMALTLIGTALAHDLRRRRR
jgi:hypothetical protein